MKLTVAESRETQIPKILGLCSTDTDLYYRYLNEAVLRLLPRGQWRGTVLRYRICTSADCITWPRQVESILSYARCNLPGQIRSHWYEFLGYGPGQITPSEWCSGEALIDRGLAPAFDDICGENKKIRIYCDLTADVGAQILLQGWDQYRNPILTDNGDVEGEEVTLAMPWVDTDTVWAPSGLTGVQKPVTKGRIRLFSLDTVTGLQAPLAIYEPDETLPEYRRSIIPGNSSTSTCCNNSSSEDCTDKTIVVLAKLKFVPVKKETDYLMIGHYPALKDMCQAIKKRENNLIADALAYEASAIAELEHELSNFHGDGTQDPVAAINSAIFAGSGVTSLL